MANVCPHCGSKNTKIYANVAVTCTIDDNGDFSVDERWGDTEELKYEILSTFNKIEGYCYDCRKKIDLEYNYVDNRVFFKK